jgi:hypothetical protein
MHCRLNRRCVPRCGAGTYDATPTAVTATCLNVTACPFPSFTATAATPASDTVCRDARSSMLCGDLSSCAYDGVEGQYRGTANSTVSGTPCIAWSAQNADGITPDAPVYANAGLTANNCRNPDQELGGPWCYTSPAGDWEGCGVCTRYVARATSGEATCRAISLANCVEPYVAHKRQPHALNTHTHTHTHTHTLTQPTHHTHPQHSR